MTCSVCRELLSEALDLCVRARKLDMQQRAIDELAASSEPDEWLASGRFEVHSIRHNIRHPDAPMTSCLANIPAWVEEQYDSDLAKWEDKARKHLTKCEEVVT